MELTRTLSYCFPLVRGDDVRAVQLALVALHCDPPCGSADGIYGAATQDAVRGFQHAYNVALGSAATRLQEDGIVGRDTWTALFRRADAAGAPSASIQSASRALPPQAFPAAPAAVSTTDTGALPKGEMPVNQSQAGRVKRWLLSNFGPAINAAITGTAIDTDVVCAIAAKETACYWLAWSERLAPVDVLAAAVFDASGDAPGTSRSAFPADTAAFRARFRDGLSNDLIAAANVARRLRSLPDAQWVYKGYGIFQYDLQNIDSDEPFFRQHLWGDIGQCLDRLMRELHEKLDASAGDLRGAVRRYNGSGAAAEEYAAQVMLIRQWCGAVTV